MRLSEAIREGSKLHPQGFRANVAVWQDGVHTCALGAAYEAIEIKNEPREWSLFFSAICPVCDRPGQLGTIITHLNDDHRWTREAIADWVAQRHERTPNAQANLL